MIQTEPTGSVSVIRLDRAAKRNALTPAMLASLAKAVETAASAHAIVLSGIGEVFCAGFDLSLCRDDNSVLGELLTGLSRAIRSLRTAPCPVVISAHGAAIAGGCALLGGADVVVTNADAKIGYPVVKLGISPAVSAAFVRMSMGDGAARARLLDSELVTGRDAVRLGLAHECVETVAECEPRAMAIAQELAAKPRHAIGYTKHWLNQIDGSLDQTAIEAGLRASLSLVGSDEQVERLAAIWKRS